jgi:hypothetical protein
MLQLDERLDADPTPEDVKAMAETRIRNLQAFNELQSFNDTGFFKYDHPLIRHKTERAELEKLLRTDTEEFLRKHRRTLDSIRRYESYLKRKDRKDKRDSDRALLEKHRNTSIIIKSILNSRDEKGNQ